MDLSDSFVTPLSKGLLDIVCAELLGEGLSRKVYVYKLDPSLVVKFEFHGGYFQNVIEWKTWIDMLGNRYRRWFAPCREISPCGTVLIMERATQFPDKSFSVPGFFEDVKHDNFGLIDGKVVCVDYGLMHRNIPVPHKEGKIHLYP